MIWIRSQDKFSLMNIHTGISIYINCEIPGEYRLRISRVDCVEETYGIYDSKEDALHELDLLQKFLMQKGVVFPVNGRKAH